MIGDGPWMMLQWTGCGVDNESGGGRTRQIN